MKFLLASLQALTKSKNYSENRNKFLFRLYFALLGNVFPVYIQSRLSEQFSGSQADYRTTFRDTGGYQKTGTSSLNRVTEKGISQLESDFLEPSRNFNFDFLHKKTT
jgi:hypothetical protein